MIKRLLVANRGEIALRVFRTAERMGIETIAIYTDLDADAPHVGACEFTERVASYLDIDEVVAAAVRSGADAVHPGYGFLSERAEFARALETAGIILVGPSAEVMEQMGRKDHARAIAERAGVPVVPRGEDAAYPVLVKAAAGGGGKGMRVVHSADELDEAIAAAKREALAAFGDDTMLIEKYVEHGRHIEVQIMADSHGTVLHLHERDCSSQRRHQKVIEEAPAPNLSPEVRALVTSSAVALAREVGYVNAGTVEFLLDPDPTGGTNDAVYFLEMNTRLQVEHPVTEAITGLDLVEGQLRVASGEPLGLTQAQVRCDGHAMEARVYAEDAFGGFLPQAGTATAVVWPEAARVDHALESGQVVSTSYDPMLGKVIVHGPDRESARLALIDALDHTAIFGLTTNTGYLRALAASPEFAAGEVDTAWLDTHDLTPPGDGVPRALAGVLLAEDLAARPRGPWQADGFRLGGVPGPMIEHGRELSFTGWSADSALTDGVRLVSVLGTGDGYVRRAGASTEVVQQGHRFVLDAPDPFADRGPDAGDGRLVAPMPGAVLAVNVAAGDVVAEGQTVGVLEAMKMELALKAPFAGTVAEVDAVVGKQVALGAVLFVIEPAEGGS